MGSDFNFERTPQKVRSEVKVVLEAMFGRMSVSVMVSAVLRMSRMVSGKWSLKVVVPFQSNSRVKTVP